MTEALATEHIRAAVSEALSIVEGIKDPANQSVVLGKVLDRLLWDVRPAVLPSEHVRPVGIPSPRSVSSAQLRDGPTAWVEDLHHEGFFTNPRTLSDVTEGVRARGHNVLSKNVTDPLEKLVTTKRLRRTRSPSEGQKRGVWFYTNY